MIEYRLNIGDVMASRGNVTYTCFGLGSCVGLFIQDRLTRMSAGAHILLPESANHGDTVIKENKFYDVDSAMNEILRQFRLAGSDLRSLRAKVTGGANVTTTGMNTGERNYTSVLTYLTEYRIYLAAADVGGTWCRTARFHSHNGELLVRKPQLNELTIY